MTVSEEPCIAGVVLSSSRAILALFTVDQTLESFLRGSMSSPSTAAAPSGELSSTIASRDRRGGPLTYDAQAADLLFQVVSRRYEQKFH